MARAVSIDLAFLRGLFFQAGHPRHAPHLQQSSFSLNPNHRLAESFRPADPASSWAPQCDSDSPEALGLLSTDQGLRRVLSIHSENHFLPLAFPNSLTEADFFFFLKNESMGLPRTPKSPPPKKKSLN